MKPLDKGPPPLGVIDQPCDTNTHPTPPVGRLTKLIRHLPIPWGPFLHPLRVIDQSYVKPFHAIPHPIGVMDKPSDTPTIFTPGGLISQPWGD